MFVGFDEVYAEFPQRRSGGVPKVVRYSRLHSLGKRESRVSPHDDHRSENIDKAKKARVESEDYCDHANYVMSTNYAKQQKKELLQTKNGVKRMSK